MHRIFFGAVAALAMGFIGGVTIGLITPADKSVPIMSTSIPVPTMTYAHALSPPISEWLPPANAEPSAAEPDAPVIALEAVATQIRH